MKKIKIESGSFAALVRSYKKSLNMLAVLQHICQENDVALSMLPDEVCELINQTVVGWIFLQSLLDNSSVPVITAFILGILTAISPCPLATNITAIGFIGKDIENRHRIFINGLLYTFGRIVTYTVLGVILIPVLREGASMYMVQKVVK